MGRRKLTDVEAPKKIEIPLNDMLNAIDTCDTGFYSRLSPELRDSFNPWLAMRYVSSCSGKYLGYYLISVNDFVNVDFSCLSKHPELVWKLLCVCGVGTKQYHSFIPPGKKRRKNKVQTELSKLMPNLKLDELEQIITMNSQAELREYFVSAGYADDQIDKMFE